jgi:hypothetical protein
MTADGSHLQQFGMILCFVSTNAGCQKTQERDFLQAVLVWSFSQKDK